MRNLNFKTARAENFICFGPEGIEIDFQKYGNIVLIRGRICDVRDDEDEEVRRSSNGSGKSSIPEILTYTLYGKTIKKPKKIAHKDVINNQSGKKLRTEVVWGDYRVVRTRKPDSLRIWESAAGVWDDSTEITLGGMPATQKLIEDKIGLSYEAFVNVVVFTDDSNTAFLECDSPDKRQIVENLLSLEKYRDYGENAKRMLRDSKEKVKVLAKEYELLIQNHAACEKHAAGIERQEQDWKAQRLAEMKRLLEQIKTQQAALQGTEGGDDILKYKEAQEQIQKLNDSITALEEKRRKADDFLVKNRASLDKFRESRHADAIAAQTCEMTIRRIQREIADKEKAVSELRGKKGTCPWCYGNVDSKNFQHVIDHALEAQASSREEIRVVKEELEAVQVKLAKLDANIAKLQDIIEDAEGKQRNIVARLKKERGDLHAYSQVREPRPDSAQLLLEQRITELKSQAVAKKAELQGPTPYEKILEDARKQADERAASCNRKREEIQKEEGRQPYYEYWIKAFGDNGIRKFVIDGIIPALNSKIAYWLQHLIDNKIDLKFDNQLEETIHRNPEDGNPFVYHMLSKGQRQRLNLAVSQAFAHVMMLNSGTSPSVVFLDEVTTNVDPAGVQGVYNMICELAREKQVFVTTHDQDLLGLLHGCQSVNLEMRDGITKMV